MPRCIYEERPSRVLETITYSVVWAVAVRASLYVDQGLRAGGEDSQPQFEMGEGSRDFSPENLKNL